LKEWGGWGRKSNKKTSVQDGKGTRQTHGQKSAKSTGNTGSSGKDRFSGGRGTVFCQKLKQRPPTRGERRDGPRSGHPNREKLKKKKS